MKSNVYQFPGTQHQAEASSAPAKKILTQAQREQTAAVSRSINAAFANVLTQRQDEKSSATGASELPKYGPYRTEIIYEDGKVNHTAGMYTDKLRRVRKFTENSVELRCDELGLAVYVALYSKVERGVLKSGVRVVQYDFRAEQPTTNIIVPISSLQERLVTILTSTYNELNRKYNIAGIDPKSIVLRSSNPAFPNIPLIEGSTC